MAINNKKDIDKDQKDVTQFAACDAIILYPSLGCPAIVKVEKDSAWLEMVIVSKSNDLRATEIAFHLRYSDWIRSHGNNMDYKPLSLYEDYFLDDKHKDELKNIIKISDIYDNSDDTFGAGRKEDNFFTLQLGQMNAFPWVLESHKENGYPYIYKIGINLKYEKDCLYEGKLFNFIWLERSVHEQSQKRPSLLKFLSDMIKEKFLKKKFKTFLSDFDAELGGGEKFVTTPKEEVMATRYHPVYVSFKEQLSIGHVTDIHLDSRMELYSQSVASVIEVNENCKGGVKIENNERVIKNSDFYSPLKNMVANFNKLFMDISGKLLNKSDILVITGDLIDYNKGIHTDQTVKIKDKKPSEVWNSLASNFLTLDNKEHIEDRNWFMFYKHLLELYTLHRKPIFTMLGNHDYVKHAMAPWPLYGMAWEGVHDMNLTRYENALCFGEGYNDHREFIHNIKTSVDNVKWYTYFINPFPDYVVDYGGQSMFMVDWGEAGVFPGKGIVDAVTMSKLPVRHPGTLHHAPNLFCEKSVFEIQVTEVDSNGDEKTTNKTIKKMPYPIKNYTIYKSWIERSAKVRMLFTHATAICPRDNISIGEINNSFTWADDELRFGTFDCKRDIILKDVEDGKLHIIVGGHSHRNVVMSLNKKVKNPIVLGAGEMVNTDFMEPAHLSMVTSSGGPFPKYLPGAPLICACEKYNSGFYYEWDVHPLKLKMKTLYSGGNFTKTPEPLNECPNCHMPGSDMERKPARRHRPGGNLLLFENGKVKIESVIADLKQIKPRKAVMCEEQGVFVDDMKLEDIKSENVFNRLDAFNEIDIISRNAFTYYGYMEFPINVEYITFKFGKLQGRSDVKLTDTEKKFEKVVNQKIIKDSFEEMKDSAARKKNLAFTKYYFEPNQFWDREIKFSKSWVGIATDIKEEIKGVAYNIPEALKVAHSAIEGGTYYPDLYSPVHDDFDGLLIEFIITPDFDKRRDQEVCGY